MRKLAQELDAGAATLYWHVGDKEQLLGLLLDRIVGENQVPEPDPEHWQEQRQGVRPRDAAAVQPPPRRRAALDGARCPTGPNSLPVLERTLALLAAAALPPRVIAYAADMFALFVGAFAFEESMPPPDVDRRCGDFLKSLPPEEFPLAHRPRRRPRWPATRTSASSGRSNCSSRGLEAMALRERRRHQDG